MLVAMQSPDQSTQNGVVIARELPSLTIEGEKWDGLAAEYNRPTPGVRMTDAHWERPRKYAYLEHAERNAIFACARGGVPTEGSVMCAVWAACADCARAIVMAGVSELHTIATKDDAHWNESTEWGNEIMEAGRVEVVRWSVDDLNLSGLPVLLRNGEAWVPGC